MRKIATRNHLPMCECGIRTQRVYAVSFLPKVWKSSKLWHNFEPTPIRFATENEMRKRCRQDGVECGQIL